MNGTAERTSLDDEESIVALAMAYDRAGLERIRTVSIIREDVVLTVRTDWMQRVTKTRLSIEVSTAFRKGTLAFQSISPEELRLTFGARMATEFQVAPERLFTLYAPCDEDGGPCAAGWIHKAARA